MGRFKMMDTSEISKEQRRQVDDRWVPEQSGYHTVTPSNQSVQWENTSHSLRRKTPVVGGSFSLFHFWRFAWYNANEDNYSFHEYNQTELIHFKKWLKNLNHRIISVWLQSIGFDQLQKTVDWILFRLRSSPVCIKYSSLKDPIN